MRESDAYQDEMGRFLRLSDDEVETLFSEGTPSPEGLDSLADLLVEAREVLQVRPDLETQARHVAALAEASRLLARNGIPEARPEHARPHAEPPRWRRVLDRTKSFALKVTVGVLAASTSMIGLAYAGVDLPGEAAEKALERVTGLELPNQDGSRNDKAVNDDVRAVLDSELEGCERGQGVSAAASQNRQGDGGSDRDPCASSTADRDSAEKDANGSRATGEEKSGEGRANAAEKSEGRSEAGRDNAADGKSTASEKSDGASNAGSGNAANDPGTGQGGSEAGQAHQPDDPSATGNEASGERAQNRDR